MSLSQHQFWFLSGVHSWKRWPMLRWRRRSEIKTETLGECGVWLPPPPAGRWSALSRTTTSWLFNSIAWCRSFRGFFLVFSLSYIEEEVDYICSKPSMPQFIDSQEMNTPSELIKLMVLFRLTCTKLLYLVVAIHKMYYNHHWGRMPRYILLI